MTGDGIDVRAEYARRSPARAQREMQIFSIVDPNLFRLYRWDEVTELVRSVPGKVDHASKLECHVAIRDMSDFFGPETRIVAALASPVFMRKVLIPEELVSK